MASDEDYSAFLDKANQDTGAAKNPPAQGKAPVVTMNQKDVHPAIRAVDEVYVSESDEPFEPVSLDWEGGEEVTNAEFGQLLGSDPDVETLSPREWDPKGQYKKVIEAVNKAGKSGVKIFKVDFGGTRLEYYVVTVDKQEGHVVGMKARSIES